MSEDSAIEWTDATWNPIAGCSVVSPGCANCYAMKSVAPRLSANPATPHYAGTVQQSNAGPVWTGRIGIAGERTFGAPLRWKRPRRIFVNSTSDLFHEGVPDAVIDRVFAIMALCPQHTCQVLTKRSARMREYLTKVRDHIVGPQMQIIEAARAIRPDDLYCMTDWPLPNVWLGVSAEDQKRADERVPDLLATPAAIRFVSAEPLLGPIDFTKLQPAMFDALANSLNGVWRWSGGPNRTETPSLDWIIVGGESGRGARPMHPDWARQIRDQCAAARGGEAEGRTGTGSGVAFFFKQWGEWAPGENAPSPPTRTERTAVLIDDRWDYGKITPRESEEMHRDDEPDVYHLGKHRAGRLLDGVEHSAFPSSPLVGEDSKARRAEGEALAALGEG